MTYLFVFFAFFTQASENPNLILNRKMIITEQEQPVKISREIIYPDRNRVQLLVTCHFLEIGIGPNITVTLEALAEVNEKYVSHLETKMARVYTPKKDYYCNAVIRKSRNRYVVLDEQHVLVGEDVWQFSDTSISNRRK